MNMKNFRLVLALAGLSVSMLLSGCTKQEKTVGGAVLGAGTGALIGGAASGNAGGAIAGGAIGGVAGGLIGHSLGDDEGK